LKKSAVFCLGDVVCQNFELIRFSMSLFKKTACFAKFVQNNPAKITDGGFWIRETYQNLSIVMFESLG
jgi:hypothetical protein